MEKKSPDPHIFLKSSINFCASIRFHSWYALSRGVNQLSFSKAEFCFAGLLGPSLQTWEILSHLLKCTNLTPANHHSQNPSALRARAGSRERSRELPCAKALAFLNTRFWMYIASETLASLRSLIKDTCATEYTEHKCVNHVKALGTSTNTDTLWGKFQ